jgi:hypothetical protein
MMGILLSRSHGVRPSAARFLPEALNGIYRKDGTQPMRVHNRAEDWRHVFLELAQEHPDASLEELHQLSLEKSARRKSGILTASRAASVKHTDWSHEKEIRLLAPKSGALPVLGEVLKRVHYVRPDGEHWGAIMQLLRAYYPAVETTHWQFNHGMIGAISTPMEIRLIPV